MATAYQNLSACDNNTVPYSPQLRVAVVCAEWNADITGQLLKGACDTLEKHGVKPENIFVEYVPGTYELTFGAQRTAAHYRPDAVIVLGCVIQGDTPTSTMCAKASPKARPASTPHSTYRSSSVFSQPTTNNKPSTVPEANMATKATKPPSPP